MIAKSIKITIKFMNTSKDLPKANEWRSNWAINSCRKRFRQVLPSLSRTFDWNNTRTVFLCRNEWTSCSHVSCLTIHVFQSFLYVHAHKSHPCICTYINFRSFTRHFQYKRLAINFRLKISMSCYVDVAGWRFYKHICTLRFCSFLALIHARNKSHG